MKQKIYQVDGFKVYIDKGLVTHNGKPLAIDDTSFALLLAFMHHPEKPFSREEILTSVWKGQARDAGDVDQAIATLKALFKGVDPIHTLPDGRYIWIVAYSQWLDEDPDEELSAGRKAKWQAPWWAVAAVFAMVVSGISLFWPTPTKASLTGAVIILPVSTEMDDQDYRWVRYGAMDMLIRRLEPTVRLGIYQTGDVIDVLRRAKLPLRTLNNQEILKIFAVTGANLIVQTQLKGQADDYQLHYTLFNRNGQQQGVVLDQNFDRTLDKLARVISTKTGNGRIRVPDDFQSDFKSEMLAQALGFYQQEEYSRTESFLEEKLTQEENNVSAWRLYGQAVLVQDKVEKAADVLNQAYAKAEAVGNMQEMARIAFWQAAALLKMDKVAPAFAVTERAIAHSKAIDDWLYLAYSIELKGHVHLAQNQQDKADALYLEAIRYHEVIECPYGEAINYLNLARLWKDRGDDDKVKNYTEKARVLITERTLNTLSFELNEWLKNLRTE